MELNQLIEYICTDNALLDEQVEQSQIAWKHFWNGFSSHVSVIRVNGRPVLGPVVSVATLIRVNQGKIVLSLQL